MKRNYLEVAFDRGKPIAGYDHLPRDPHDAVARTQRHEQGIRVDYTSDGRAIGIEFTAPSRCTLEGVNRVLAELHQQPATRDELGPLIAA